MKQAIALTYVEYQNCPSQPHRTIINVSDHVTVRDEELKVLFQRIATDDAELDEITISDVPTEYGDITVSAEDFGVYMYLTFIK